MAPAPILRISRQPPNSDRSMPIIAEPALLPKDSQTGSCAQVGLPSPSPSLSLFLFPGYTSALPHRGHAPARLLPARRQSRSHRGNTRARAGFSGALLDTRVGGRVNGLA